MLNYNHKLLSHITAEVPKIIAALILLSFISVYTFYNYIPITYISIWVVAQTFFIYLRYSNSISIKKHLSNDNNFQLNRDVKKLLFITIYSALLWNAIVFLGITYAPASYEYVGVVMIMGIVAGAIMSLAQVYSIYVIYFFIMVIPQNILFAQYDDHLHQSILLFSLIYTPFMLVISKSMHDNVLQNIEINKTLQINIEKLHKLSITDTLTNIYNRRYLFDTSKEILDLAIPHNANISLLMIDIDYFKSINDNYGHQAGDTILVELSKKISDMIKQSDIFARVGGEEFAILLNNTSKVDTIDFANNICNTIRNEIFRHKEQELHITVSIGVAILSQETKSLDSLYHIADTKLYAAKTLGRDRVCD